MKAIFTIPIPEETKMKIETTGITAVYKDKKDVTAEDLKDAEMIFGNVSADLLNTSDTLRLAQLDSAGAAQYSYVKDSITVCNASGAYDTAISEHMLACTLAVMKNLYEYHELQEQQNWFNLGSVPTISMMHVLSVGMGNIGSAYAEKMHLLGAQVDGVRRTVHDIPDYINHMYTLNELKDIIGKYDIVALSLPGTKETENIFDYELLSAMKKGAIILNVGRGSAIVEEDLIRIMKEKHLRAACLDVTQHEPLPENDPLWTTENVYITPHISGRFNAAVTYDKVINIFMTNLYHYLNNEPLVNIVDKTKGY